MAEPPDPVYSFRGDMGNILCLLLDVTSGMELLFIGTSEGFVHKWDLKMKRELKKIRVSHAPCTSVIKCPEGFVTLGKGQAVDVWDCEWNMLWEIPIDYCGFSNIDYCGDLLIPVADGKIQLAGLDGKYKGQLFYKYNKKHGELMCIKYLKTLGHILSGYESGLVAVWDKTGKTICEAQIEGTLMCLDYCDKTGKIVTGASGNFISKFSLINNALTLDCTNEIANPGISSVSIRSDGKLCVATCWDARVRYFSMKTLKLLAVMDNRTVPNRVLFSDFEAPFTDPDLAFVGDSDGRITIWKLYSSSAKVQ